MQEAHVRSLGWEDPLSRKWHPTPVFLPGKSLGQRSLEGYSPWGHKELDTTEQPSFHFLKVYFSKKEADTEEDMPKLIPLGGINEVTNGKLTR